ncbi:MAG TPA: hypothetical protein PKH39_02085 [Woeseiaceae bacterium]|nr:hypothetical protein [Woeseiaceae bacterium]
MKKLEIYQSLWAMELRNPNVPERSKEEAFAMISVAGFDGACMDPSVEEIPECREYAHLFDVHNLKAMVNAFPHSAEDLAPILDFAVEIDATLVNVIGGVMPIRPEDAVTDVRRWIDEAADRDMPLLFETHRDGLLNDLFFTLQLMEFVPELRLCADLSHFVVDREMRAPISARDQAYISAVLQRSDCFQGRIASREQIQVQINFPQHQQWVDIFRGWWTEGMRDWRKRNDDKATLAFLCELGPPPYAITDARQDELSDRWRESLTIRDWVRTIWSELENEG